MSRRPEYDGLARPGEARFIAPLTAVPQPMIRQRVGRGLQFLGLVILPFGIASELVEKVGLGQSMLIAAGGALVFYVGYVMQHR